eukprot:jgi/Antlo1/792/1441
MDFPAFIISSTRSRFIAAVHEFTSTRISTQRFSGTSSYLYSPLSIFPTSSSTFLPLFLMRTFAMSRYESRRILKPKLSVPLSFAFMSISLLSL